MSANFVAGRDDAERRVDVVLRKLLRGVSLGRIYRALRTGEIRVDGKRVSQSHRVAAGATISIPENLAQEVKGHQEISVAIQPGVTGPGEIGSGTVRPGAMGTVATETITPLIVFRNEHLLALNKPAGMLVHSGDRSDRSRSRGGRSAPGEPPLDTLVRQYLAQFESGAVDNAESPQRAGRAESLSFRPGPVHRIDRNTSGLLLFSASLEGARALSTLIRTGAFEKLYLALLDGAPGAISAGTTHSRASERAIPDHHARGRIGEPPLSGSSASVAGGRDPVRDPVNENQRVVIWDDSLLRDPGAKKTLIDSAGSSTSQTARTVLVPLATFPGPIERTLCLIRIDTGRSHQIRAHAAAHGHPLSGDRKYGGAPVDLDQPGNRRDNPPRNRNTQRDRLLPSPPYYLHAYSLRVTTANHTFPPWLPPLRAPLPPLWRDTLSTICDAPEAEIDSVLGDSSIAGAAARLRRIAGSPD